jgi:fibronectin type 3 domain-containing protein
VGEGANVTFEIIDDEEPEAPTGLTVVDRGDGQSLEVSWEANSEVDLAGYNVYRSVIPGSSYQLIEVVNPANTSWVDEGLQNGITYYYVITAFDSAVPPNESQYSNEADGTPSVITTASDSFSFIMALAAIIIVSGLIIFVFLKWKTIIKGEEPTDKENVEKNNKD